MLAHQNKYVSTTSAFNKFRVFLNAAYAAVIFTLLLFTTLAQAGQVSLAWDPSPSPDVGGYKVVYGLASGTYTSTVDVGKQTSTTVANLDDSKTYYFAARAYNTARTVESANSNEVSKPASTTLPPPSTALPSPWVSADIGNAGLVGSVSHANGAFTMKGSGDDIWNTADAFRFAYQPLNGDGSIVARVASITNTDSWAKAGVMIRENLDANARNALVAVTSANGVTFQRRTATGASTSSTVTGSLSAPYWVKLMRAGNTFTAYRSADGGSWTQIGSTTISMAANVYIGLAVTSHNNSVLNTSILDNVNVQSGGASSPVAAPIASFSASPNSGTAPLMVTLTDTSVGSISSRTWTFSDGTTDTAQTVIKTFNTPGNYTATLKVTGPGGSASATRTLSATAPSLPAASFSASPTSGTAPLTVRFTDTSSGTVTAWSWDFGDGTSSTQQNPSHTYTTTTAKTYTVKLTATNSAGSNTKTQSSYITVSPSTSTGGSGNTGGGSTGGGTNTGSGGNGSTSAVFQQGSATPNLLVIEAEHFNGNTAQGDHAWQATTSYGNYSNASALQALPEDNTRIDTNYTATSPRLDYQVNFVKTGTHYVWIRALGPSWSSDSLHVGLDGQEVASAARLSQLNPLGSWAWSKTTQGGTIATLNVTSPGVHIINVWMRESGTLLDKLVLTPDANYTPSSLGPDETLGQSTGKIPDSPTTGLVAAYSFEEGSGSTVADRSGQGNHGVISGASWSSRGKFGNALYFNSNDWVTVNDSASLDLTTSMTLEAWVYPTSTMSGWRCVLLKEQSNGLVYSLYANSNTNQPSTVIRVGNADQNLAGGPWLATYQWVHLAATYDGTTQRLYVNGSEVANRRISGSIQTSNGVLRIGGNSIWGEYFNGRIDEVRIYNRALNASEIQSDMNTALQ